MNQLVARKQFTTVVADNADAARLDKLLLAA